MTVFFYRCKHNNDIKEGFIEAKNIQEASSKLEKSELTILELKEQSNLKGNVYLNYELTPLTIKEKKDFYNSFYKQYKAGIPFHEIFNNIMATASSGNIKAICFNIIKKLQKNNTIEDIKRKINGLVLIIDSFEYNINLKLLVDKLIISMFGVD